LREEAPLVLQGEQQRRHYSRWLTIASAQSEVA
jgi:hypothetical protein